MSEQPQHGTDPWGTPDIPPAPTPRESGRGYAAAVANAIKTGLRASALIRPGRPHDDRDWEAVSEAASDVQFYQAALAAGGDHLRELPPNQVAEWFDGFDRTATGTVAALAGQLNRCLRYRDSISTHLTKSNFDDGREWMREILSATAARLSGDEPDVNRHFVAADQLLGRLQQASDADAVRHFVAGAARQAETVNGWAP